MDPGNSWASRLRENLAFSLAASLRDEESQGLDSHTEEPKASRKMDSKDQESQKEVERPNLAEAVEGTPASIFHSLFSDATETWLQGQSSSGSDSRSVERRDVPSLQNSSMEESSHDYEADEDYEEENDEESDNRDYNQYDDDDEEEEEENEMHGSEGEEDEESQEYDTNEEEREEGDAFEAHGSEALGHEACNYKSDHKSENDDDIESDSNGNEDGSESRESPISLEVVDPLTMPSNVSPGSDSYGFEEGSQTRDSPVTFEVLDPLIMASSASDDSTMDRRAKLSGHRESSDSINTSSSEGPQGSVEFEMGDFHTSWTTIKSESQSSSSFSSLGGSTEVFVRDTFFCWLPATVLEYHKDHAVVSVVQQEAWDESTFLGKGYGHAGIHSSMKNTPSNEIDHYTSNYGVSASNLRKVFYRDYDDGDLPKQNVQGYGKRNMEDLMFQHPAAILYNLKDRHYQQKPYTRVGDILIAMNPFVWINELYSPETRELYSRHLIWNGKPCCVASSIMNRNVSPLFRLKIVLFASCVICSKPH
jgi:hypothetical protein